MLRKIAIPLVFWGGIAIIWWQGGFLLALGVCMAAVAASANIGLGKKG